MIPGNSTGSQRVLSVVRLDGVAYVVDLGHRQFRESFNPRKRVDFDAVRGQELCRRVGVVTCLSCGMSAIIAVEAREDDLM